MDGTATIILAVRCKGVLQFPPFVAKACYNSLMPIHVSEKELDAVESGREAAVIVRSDRTKKGYAEWHEL
jgi:hypothetical protein